MLYLSRCPQGQSNFASKAQPTSNICGHCFTAHSVLLTAATRMHGTSDLVGENNTAAVHSISIVDRSSQQTYTACFLGTRQNQKQKSGVTACCKACRAPTASGVITFLQMRSILDKSHAQYTSRSSTLVPNEKKMISAMQPPPAK